MQRFLGERHLVTGVAYPTELFHSAPSSTKVPHSLFAQQGNQWLQSKLTMLFIIAGRVYYIGSASLFLSIAINLFTY